MTNIQNIQVATHLGCFLSSRESAANLRTRALSTDGVCRFDFTGVVSVSDSFADELFAVIVQLKGHDWFSEHIHVTGHSPEIRNCILRAVHLRCELA